ncbi:ComF family protein [Alteromonas pelagimontana]|uniref:ComF family protein n=1 Tax=Alteromonas pelagimontana TaxID=1858656 RepID=A0A6M4M9Y4_9ALTE|nr:ComF family protein [Alteromonas pelagimontana]QJR79974.1 ComF family protein [Alteromonas pelagimontana]
MDVNIKQIDGIWTLGYSLDKHTLSSTPTGYNEYGHMQFDTIRPEAGEALYQLKYRSDYSQVGAIASQLSASFGQAFSSASLVIPMPASKVRSRQPVTEIATEYARLRGIPCREDLLVKTGTTAPMKDIESRDEKISALIGAFTVYDVLPDGKYDVLIIDDLFDTGSSLEAATTALKNYPKIGNVYVATVTRKR